MIVVVGLTTQTLLGLLLLKILDQKDQFGLSLSASIAAGFLLGIPLVLLLSFRNAFTAFSVLALAGTGFFLAMLSRLSVSQRDTGVSKDIINRELRKLAIAFAIVNLVVIRFVDNSVAIVVLLSGLFLVVMPTAWLRIGFGVYLSCLTVNSLLATSISMATPLTGYRFDIGWIEEQVFAKSIGELASVANPYFYGEVIQYHFFSAAYWGAFESLLKLESYIFSGAIFLVCSVVFMILLLLDMPFVSKWIQAASTRILIVVALYGSWGFWDSSALDEHSRSQSLSLALVALTCRVLTSRTWWNSLVLVPALVAMTTLTKVTSGYFACSMLLIYTIANLWSLIRIQKIHQIKADIALQILRLIASASAVVTVLLFVFVIPSSSAGFGHGKWGLLYPDIYSHPNSMVNWMQFALAFFPLTAILISTVRIGSKVSSSSERATRISLAGASLASVLLGLTFQNRTGIQAPFYVAGVSAVFGSFSTAGLSVYRSITRITLVASLTLLASFTLLFANLERQPTPQWHTAPVILLVAVLLILGTYVLTSTAKSMTLGLLMTMLMLNFGVSVGRTVALRIMTPEIAADASFQPDFELAKHTNAVAFFKTVDASSIVAIEDGGRNDFTAEFLGGSTPIQFFAAPRFVMQYLRGDAVNDRLSFQKELVEEPNETRLEAARSAGISHVVITTSGSRFNWERFIRQQKQGELLPESIVKPVFASPVLQVIQL